MALVFSFPIRDEVGFVDYFSRIRTIRTEFDTAKMSLTLSIDDEVSESQLTGIVTGIILAARLVGGVDVSLSCAGSNRYLLTIIQQFIASYRDLTDGIYLLLDATDLSSNVSMKIQELKERQQERHNVLVVRANSSSHVLPEGQPPSFDDKNLPLELELACNMAAMALNFSQAISELYRAKKKYIESNSYLLSIRSIKPLAIFD